MDREEFSRWVFKELCTVTGVCVCVWAWVCGGGRGVLWLFLGGQGGIEWVVLLQGSLMNKAGGE